MSSGPSSGGPGRSRPFGLGLGGGGVIATTYAAALEGLDGARLVAVTDVDAAAGEPFAAAHGLAYDRDLDKLLGREEVDVVCVCVPSGLHAEIGLAAARAGKHLVVEKPIDVTREAARELIAGAAAAGAELAAALAAGAGAGAADAGLATVEGVAAAGQC